MTDFTLFVRVRPLRKLCAGRFMVFACSIGLVVCKGEETLFFLEN